MFIGWRDTGTAKTMVKPHVVIPIKCSVCEIWVIVPCVKAFALPTAALSIQTQEGSEVLAVGVLSDFHIICYYGFKSRMGESIPLRSRPARDCVSQNADGVADREEGVGGWGRFPCQYPKGRVCRQIHEERGDETASFSREVPRATDLKGNSLES